MTLLTTPKVQPDTVGDNDAEPIDLYKLGMLFVIECRYWSCRVGNDPDDLELSQDRIDAKAIASFSTKGLLDPEKTRKVFQQIEKRARHALEKHSGSFAAANAHFVPWNHVQTVIEQLETFRAEFDRAVQQFLSDYACLRADWQAQHPEIPDACYPLPVALPAKFGLSWHAFKVAGAPELTPVEDIELELEQRRARDEQVNLIEANLKRECQQFVEQYVLGFRRKVAEFCDHVIAQKGQVHGKTLNSIRDRIDRFHSMNVFGDGDAAGRLTQLKQQIAGLTGQDLAQQPDVAAKLGRACQALKNHILNPDAVSQLTGRLKRRVVLD
ncbi:MAG: DUF3150 domain-containing protein [Planctomycetes bacterium]|nr:DUF3150 domain-containing protein [Planctomycetota bacterium]